MALAISSDLRILLDLFLSFFITLWFYKTVSYFLEQMFKYKPLTQVIIFYNIYGIIEYYVVYHKLWLKNGFVCIPNYHLYFYGKMHSRF